jgi:hypothetical protein
LITVSQTGLPGIRDVVRGASPLLDQLGPFLEELNPIFNWLGQHQQLTSDFISNGAAGIAAKTTSVGGGGNGHYLRQFSPAGAETLGIYPNRDSGNRGNTYPAPLWLANPENLQKGNFPSWDCKNTSTGGSVPAIPGPVGPIGGLGSRQACWIAPTLPGAKPGQIPHILKKSYSSR